MPPVFWCAIPSSATPIWMARWGFADLVAVAQHYDQSGAGVEWFTGDFNYDGTVGFADLVAVAQHSIRSSRTAPVPGASADFNGDLAAAFASVPEPGAAAFLAACGFATVFAAQAPVPLNPSGRAIRWHRKMTRQLQNSVVIWWLARQNGPVATGAFFRRDRHEQTTPHRHRRAARRRARLRHQHGPGSAARQQQLGQHLELEPDRVSGNDGTADVIFGGNSNRTPDLTASWNVKSVTFDNTAGAFDLKSTAAITLTIGAGGLPTTTTTTKPSSMPLSLAQRRRGLAPCTNSAL